MMETFKTLLGPEHPNTLSSMGGLASTYSNLWYLGGSGGTGKSWIDIDRTGHGTMAITRSIQEIGFLSANSYYTVGTDFSYKSIKAKRRARCI
jgi:hypothetical protein